MGQRASQTASQLEQCLSSQQCCYPHGAWKTAQATVASACTCSMLLQAMSCSPVAAAATGLVSYTGCPLYALDLPPSLPIFQSISLYSELAAHALFAAITTRCPCTIHKAVAPCLLKSVCPPKLVPRITNLGSPSRGQHISRRT